MLHTPFSKDTILRAMIAQHIQHVITVNHCKKSGYIMPKPCDTLEHALRFADVSCEVKGFEIKEQCIKQVNKLTDRKGFPYPTDSEVQQLVELVYQSMR